jgi:type II secretory pathway pseudopilin PulG
MKRRGFTLIEALVVVGIAVVCCALLMPALNRARARAVQVQVISNLRTISVAIETYKQEHKGSYPWVRGTYAVPGYTGTWTKGYNGSIVLCHALVGPGDHDDLDGDEDPQLGFRTLAGGRVYGPYLPTDGFKIRDWAAAGRTDDIPAKSMRAPALCDNFGNPILYFPASPVRRNVRLAPRSQTEAAPYIGSSETSRYDLSDNFGPAPKSGPFGRPADPSSTEATKRVHVMLGDRNANGVVDADEQEVNEPFLLWSAGADGLYGPEVPSADAAANCDDATNFR